jgi:hypothetical protein
MQNIVTRKIFGFVLQFLVLHTYEGKHSLRQKNLIKNHKRWSKISSNHYIKCTSMVFLPMASKPPVPGGEGASEVLGNERIDLRVVRVGWVNSG